VARQREVVLDLDAARPVELGARLLGQLTAERRGADARGPDLADRLDPLAAAVRRLDLDPRGVDVDDLRTRRTSTPILVSRSTARPPSFSPKAPSTAGAASSRITRASVGSIRRKSRLRVRLASSEICPAISTPVGPAPTTTKVIRRSTSAGVEASSASSKEPKMRPRSSSASSIDFIPGAWRANWSLPNQDCPAPAATISES